MNSVRPELTTDITAILLRVLNHAAYLFPDSVPSVSVTASPTPAKENAETELARQCDSPGWGSVQLQAWPDNPVDLTRQ